MRKVRWWQQLGTQLIFVLIGLFVLVPLWGTIYLAFDGSIVGQPLEFRIWPKEFSLDVLVQVWKNPAQTLSFLGLLRNSLIVSGGAALLSVVLGTTMAYAFARYRFPGRQGGLFVLLVGALLPPVALMTPLYILLTLLHLRTTLLGLIIVYTAFSMPFCIWNMRSAFQAVPKETEEAAFLDGASPLTAFLRVSLPLALPSIAVAALMAFLTGYTEFAIGWLFVEKADNVTLAMAVSSLIHGSGRLPWSQLAMLALLMSAPVVVLFVVLQRYLLNRLVIGGMGE